MALDEKALSDGFYSWFERGMENEFENDTIKSATALAEYIVAYTDPVEITLNVPGTNPALANSTGVTDPSWGPPTLAAAPPSPSAVNALIATLAVAFDQGNTGWEYFATGQSSVDEVYSMYFDETAPPDELFRKYFVELEKEDIDRARLTEGGTRDFTVENSQPEIAVVTLQAGTSLEESFSPGYGTFITNYATWSAEGSYMGEAAPEYTVGTTVTDVNRDIKPLVGIILYEDLDVVHNSETEMRSSADGHAAAIHTATTTTSIPEGTFTNPQTYVSVSAEMFLE